MAKKPWEFKEGMHEVNVNRIYWNAMNKMKEGNIEEAASLLKEHAHLIPRILSTYVLDENMKPLVNISKVNLCYYTLLIFSKLECNECIVETVKLLEDSIYLSLAFERLIKENEEIANSIINKLMENNQEIAIYVISNISEELRERFLEHIIRIAKYEFGKTQYTALQALYPFINREEVLKLFIFFASDWDKQTRRISLNALLMVKDKEEIKKLAKRLAKEENDEVNLGIIKLILEG